MFLFLHPPVGGHKKTSVMTFLRLRFLVAIFFICRMENKIRGIIYNRKDCVVPNALCFPVRWYAYQIHQTVGYFNMEIPH